MKGVYGQDKVKLCLGVNLSDYIDLRYTVNCIVCTTPK